MQTPSAPRHLYCCRAVGATPISHLKYCQSASPCITFCFLKSILNTAARVMPCPNLAMAPPFPPLKPASLQWILKSQMGTSLVAQWMRLCAPNAGDLGSIPGQGTGSHMHAATNPWALDRFIRRGDRGGE